MLVTSFGFLLFPLALLSRLGFPGRCLEKIQVAVFMGLRGRSQIGQITEQSVEQGANAETKPRSDIIPAPDRREYVAGSLSTLGVRSIA